MPPDDPFSTLGFEPRFRIAEPELRRAWMRRAAASHPDHAGQAGASAAVNEAYRILRDPILRADALLERLGTMGGSETLGGSEPVQPPELLAALIDLRERLDEVRASRDDLLALRGEVVDALEGILLRLDAAFDRLAVEAGGGAGRDARALVGAARSYRRALEHVDLALQGPGLA